MSKKITFTYHNSKFEFSFSKESLKHFAEYSYDQECSNSNSDDICHHHYNHCQALVNIRFVKFDKLPFVKAAVSLVSGESDLLPEVIELVSRSISDITMESYLQAYGSPDYYGEYLAVSAHGLDELQSQIATNLKLEGITDVT